MTHTTLVTDPAAADFLTTPGTRYLLGPFLEAETTMRDAAASVDKPLNTFYRRALQMLAWRFIEVTREEVRRGHRVKLYRATSQVFVVPIAATRSVDRETYLKGGFGGSVALLSRGLARAMEQSAPHWGFEIAWSEGVYQQATALDEAFRPTSSGASTKPYWYGDLGVRLKPEAAQAFQRELQRLYERYRGGADDEGEWYLFFAGLAPT